jgi:glycine/D-amino acid oxidase-like deaminating enzyme
MDVVVVGGGIIGCSASAFLAEAGASVTLVEATELGAGASGRNSGAVQHPFDEVLAALHRETLAVYADLDGFPLPAEPAGLLLLTDDPGAAVDRAAELAHEHPELAAEVLDERALHEAEPMLAAGLSAIRLATGYPVPPDAAVRAFASRAEAAGARLEIGRRAVGVAVMGLTAHGVVLADGGRLGADAVLVAAGPATPHVVEPSGAWHPIIRTWGVTVQVALPTPARHVLEEGVVHTVNRVVEGDPSAAIVSLFSMVSVGETSTVGSTFLADEPDPAVVAPLLIERGARLVPALRDARVLRHRVCARPQSLDGRPLVGGLAGVDGLVMAAGHGPWGISTGPATARMAADLLLGRSPAVPAELDPNRFGPVRRP